LIDRSNQKIDVGWFDNVFVHLVTNREPRILKSRMSRQDQSDALWLALPHRFDDPEAITLLSDA
jgi:hypothetical protein